MCAAERASVVDTSEYFVLIEDEPRSGSQILSKVGGRDRWRTICDYRWIPRDLWFRPQMWREFWCEMRGRDAIDSMVRFLRALRSLYLL